MVPLEVRSDALEAKHAAAVLEGVRPGRFLTTNAADFDLDWCCEQHVHRGTGDVLTRDMNRGSAILAPGDALESALAQFKVTFFGGKAILFVPFLLLVP